MIACDVDHKRAAFGLLCLQCRQDMDRKKPGAAWLPSHLGGAAPELTQAHRGLGGWAGVEATE